MTANLWARHACPLCTQPRRVLHGARLRSRRVAAGATLHDMAATLGLSVSYLSDVERGNRECQREDVAAAYAKLGARG